MRLPKSKGLLTLIVLIANAFDKGILKECYDNVRTYVSQ